MYQSPLRRVSALAANVLVVQVNNDSAVQCLVFGIAVFLVQGNKHIDRHLFDAGVSSRDFNKGQIKSSQRALEGKLRDISAFRVKGLATMAGPDLTYGSLQSSRSLS